MVEGLDNGGVGGMGEGGRGGKDRGMGIEDRRGVAFSNLFILRSILPFSG